MLLSTLLKTTILFIREVWKICLLQPVDVLLCMWCTLMYMMYSYVYDVLLCQLSCIVLTKFLTFMQYMYIVNIFPCLCLLHVPKISSGDEIYHYFLIHEYFQFYFPLNKKIKCGIINHFLQIYILRDVSGLFEGF